MTLNGVMAVTLRYFTEFGKPALQKTICGGIYARVYCILVRVQRRRKESSLSLSHLLVSFLYISCKEPLEYVNLSSYGCETQTIKWRSLNSKLEIFTPHATSSGHTQ